MRFIKLGLISFVVFFSIATAISSMLPSQMIISRSINIHSEYDSVYQLVNDLSQWQKWMDLTASELSLSPQTVGKGATLKINKTTIIITGSTLTQVSTTWQVNQGRIMQGDYTFNSNKDQSYITVQWVFTQKLRWYPWEKFAAIASERAFAPFMEKGLTNLQQYSEHRVN